MCPPRPAPGCGVVPWSAAWLVGLALCVSPPVHSGALSGCWGVCCYCPVRLPRSGPPPGVSLPATPGPAASRRFPVSPAGAWPAVARRRGAAIFGTDVLSLPIINASGSRRRHGTHLYLPAPPRASTISGDGGQIGPPVHQSAAARAGGRVLFVWPLRGRLARYRAMAQAPYAARAWPLSLPGHGRAGLLRARPFPPLFRPLFRPFPPSFPRFPPARLFPAHCLSQWWPRGARRGSSASAPKDPSSQQRAGRRASCSASVVRKESRSPKAPAREDLRKRISPAAHRVTAPAPCARPRPGARPVRSGTGTMSGSTKVMSSPYAHGT